MASTMPAAEVPKKLNMYTDGEFVEPASGGYFESYDPCTARNTPRPRRWSLSSWSSRRDSRREWSTW